MRATTLLLLLLFGGLGAPARAESPLTDVRFEQHLGAEVARDAVFQDQEGRTVRVGDLLDGRPLVLVPGYYRCPMLCGQIRQGLVEGLRGVEETAGRDFRLVSYSIDPEEGPADAVPLRHEVLQRYDRPGADWLFLTGRQEAIDRLSRSIGFRAVRDAATGEYAHGSGVVVLAPDGRVSRVLFGLAFRAQDLRLALKEASRGALGKPLDDLLLLCYRYDPEQGRYGVQIMAVLRLAGAATVLLLLATIVVLNRRRRRQGVDP